MNAKPSAYAEWSTLAFTERTLTAVVPTIWPSETSSLKRGTPSNWSPGGPSCRRSHSSGTSRAPLVLDAGLRPRLLAR